MATTVRVRREAGPAGTADPTAPDPTLIGVGSFGEAVVHSLLEVFPAARSTTADSLDEAALDKTFAVAPGPVVMGLWRPTPALCEAADRLSWRHGVPWLPIVREEPVIRVGPWVSPGQAPCFRCYQWRRQQHESDPVVGTALRAAYDDDPTLGPAGHLPQQARLAAGVALCLLHRAAPGHTAPGHADPDTTDPGDGPAGEVVTISTLNAAMETHHVVACHGCDRCGTSTPVTPDREAPLRTLLAAGGWEPVRSSTTTPTSGATAGERI